VSEPTIVHLVPHTHWDREWYEPFQVFRMRLVALIDQLLERMAADDRLRFTLDGQAATIDDYLEIRPDAEPTIRRLIAEDRLAIGPWQILMDEFLVSGETIVRNLQFGWARAEALGRAMRVGYLPDMFGHIAQMPQILWRAGIEQAVVWRGVPMAIDRNRFLWRSPDGSTVEAEYLVGGYGNGAYLFDVPDRLAAKLAGYRTANAGFYGDRSLLAMYGTDHAVPSPRLADLVEGVNRAGGDVVVRLETLADYIARDDGTDPARPMPEWTGELRSGARANMLMNVVSARVDLKAACTRTERLLERYAEPLAALHGEAWPGRALELAWRRVVDNSAHDSICGCSHDAVVAQVLTRYAEAEQIGTSVLGATLAVIGRSVPAGHWAVVDPSPIGRIDQIQLDVAIPPAWSQVVVRCGDRLLPTQEVSRPDPIVATLHLPGRDLPGFFSRRRHGRELFGRLINGARIGPDGEARVVIEIDDLPDPAELDVEELLATIEAAAEARPDETWELVLRAADRRRLLARVPAPGLAWSEVAVAEDVGRGVEPIGHPVVVTNRSLTNGLVTVELTADGTFGLAGGGSVLTAVGRVVDGGDFGDSYNYGPPATDTIVETPDAVRVEVLERGPLRGRLEVTRRYAWPTGVESDGSRRTSTTAPTDVVMTLEVRADEPFVRVQLHFDNTSDDHRTRWHIPLAAPVDRSSAEGQYAVVERAMTVEGGHGERALPTFPARGFIHVGGLSVLLDQLTEYEVVEAAELALTVLRSTGLISRNANPFREDPAGPEVAIPAAQLHGPRSFGFALYPHTGSWDEAGTIGEAERYQHPFVVTHGTGTLTLDRTPEPRGLEIDGPGVVLSALRRVDDWLELRLVAERATAGAVTVRGPFDQAQEVDLLGRVGADLEGSAGSTTVRLGPWEVRTIRLRASSA
jgi:mannosylglycerate hydrolase